MIPQLSTSEATLMLNLLFEPCVALQTLFLSQLRDKPFTSYNDLISNVHQQLIVLAHSPDEQNAKNLDSILSAHPRLGEKSTKSAQSQAEQAQLTARTEGDEEKLAQMNAAYEQTFPGLRYVVFVNGRDRATILDDMQRRIDRNDAGVERAEAMQVSLLHRRSLCSVPRQYIQGNVCHC